MGSILNMRESRQLTGDDYATLAAFRHALRRFTAFSEAEAKAAGLTPQQHQALLALKSKPGVPSLGIGEIAAHLLIRHHTAVELVDRMAEADLVTRYSDATDGRRTLVALTSRAERILRKLAATHLEELRTIRPALLELLSKI
jgi:DNA-binding MarR family transcriptional regulator